MIPRLAAPEFGLLDDGLTLETGRKVMGQWWNVVYLIPDTGRFFPAYWFVYAIVVAIVGAHPLAFFAINTLLLAGLLAILVRLARMAGATRLQAWVAALLLAACGPTVETFYTLSKAEPCQMAWIGIALLATAAAAASERWSSRAALMSLATAALGLAYATKETSIALIPIALGWLAIEWWGEKRATNRRFAYTFLAVNVVAAALFAWLRWSFAPLALAQGWYTRAYSLQIGTVGPALFRMASWTIRNFAFLLPLAAVAAIALVRGRLARRRLVLYAFVWMAGWLAVYLPWPATFEYHLFPFAFGAAVLSGAIVGDLWNDRGRNSAVWIGRSAGSMLAGAGLLWVLTLVNAATDARVQLAVDRANTRLVDFLAGLPRRSRVLVNSTFANEYVYELPLHLSEIKRRQDIAVEHIARVSGAPPTEAYMVTVESENLPIPTVRAIVDAPAAARLAAILDGPGDLVYRGEQLTPVLELGFHRLLCRMTGPPLFDVNFCRTDRGLIFQRMFSYGWQVHRIPLSAVDRWKAIQPK